MAMNPRVRKAPEPFPPTTFHGPSPTPMVPPQGAGAYPGQNVAGDFRGQGAGQPPPPQAPGNFRPPAPQQTPMQQQLPPQPSMVSGGAQRAPAPPIAALAPGPDVAMGRAGMYPGQYQQPPSTAQGWRDMQMGLGQHAYNTLGAGVAGGYGMAAPQSAQLNPFAPVMTIGGPLTQESQDVAQRRQRLASEAKLRGAEYQPPAPASAPVYSQQTFAGPGQPPPAPPGVAPIQQQSWSSAAREAGAGGPLPQGGSTPEPQDHIFKQTAAASGEDSPGGEGWGFGSTHSEADMAARFPDFRRRGIQNADKYYNPDTHETFIRDGEGWRRVMDKRGWDENGNPYVGYDGSKGDPSEGMTWHNRENATDFVYHNGGWAPVDPKGTQGEGRWGGDAASQGLDTQATSQQKMDDAYAQQAADEEARRKWIEENYKPEQLDRAAVDNVINTQRTQNAFATSRATRAAMALTQRTGVDPSVAAIAPMEAYQNNEASSNAQGAATRLQAEMTNLQQRAQMNMQKLSELNQLMAQKSNRAVAQWAASEALKTQEWQRWYQVQQDQLQMQLAQANAARQQWGGIAGGIGAAIGSIFGPIGTAIGGAVGGIGGTVASNVGQAPAGFHQAYPGTYYSNW